MTSGPNEKVYSLKLRGLLCRHITRHLSFFQLEITGRRKYFLNVVYCTDIFVLFCTYDVPVMFTEVK